MMKMRACGLVVAGCVAACMPAVGEGGSQSTPAEAPPPVTAEPDEVDWAFEVVVDGAAPAAPLFESERGEPGHAERVGWVGGRFSYCRELPGDCTECRQVAPDGVAESFESGPGCAQGLAPHELEARLKADRPTAGAARWRAGADIVMVVETREQERTNAGEARPMLKVGARRRDDDLPAWLVHVDPCEGCGIDQVCAARAHLDALSLSPDGAWVVVLVHQTSSDGDEQLRLEWLAADRLARAARAPASSAR